MESRAARIRALLKHPVIDGDGHWLEPIPIFLEYLREVGGADAVDRIRAIWHRNNAWYRATPAERQHQRLRRGDLGGSRSGRDVIRAGGADGIRTHDLDGANVALSQLSYGPAALRCGF